LRRESGVVLHVGDVVDEGGVLGAADGVGVPVEHALRVELVEEQTLVGVRVELGRGVLAEKGRGVVHWLLAANEERVGAEVINLRSVHQDLAVVLVPDVVEHRLRSG